MSLEARKYINIEWDFEDGRGPLVLQFNVMSKLTSLPNYQTQNFTCPS